MVETYLGRWELTVVGELALSYSYVVAVERADGRACVLKIKPTDVPGVEGADRELLGLRLGGGAVVEVLEEDTANGVLLVERAVPGTTLDEMAHRDDDLATETLASVIAAYGRPVSGPAASGLAPFVDYAEVFERFDGRPQGGQARGWPAAAAVPALRVLRRTAGEVMAELVADKAPPYLLHGDLHHGNVLVDEERGLLVIDPWGLYGDREVDVGPALHNPPALVSAADDVEALMRRRLPIYAEVIGLEVERLAAWAFVHNVIGALWTLEDAGELAGNDPALRTAATLRTMI
jgi:streptomycin 6-kinase